VVQNMEGAGVWSLPTTSTSASPRMGSRSRAGRSWYVEGIVKSPGVTFDPTRFTWIGSRAPSFDAHVRAATACGASMT